MPELHVCVSCGTLTPRPDVRNHRCPQCAHRADRRINAGKGQPRSAAAEARRRQSTAGKLRASKQYRRFRRMILERDGYVCHYCGLAGDTLDHLTPLARGGDPLDAANAVCACRSCNARKGARTADEFTQAETERKRHARADKAASKHARAAIGGGEGTTLGGKAPGGVSRLWHAQRFGNHYHERFKISAARLAP